MNDIPRIKGDEKVVRMLQVYQNLVILGSEEMRVCTYTNIKAAKVRTKRMITCAPYGIRLVSEDISIGFESGSEKRRGYVNLKLSG